MIIKKFRWCLNAIKDKTKPLLTCDEEENVYWYSGIDIKKIDDKPGWTQVILNFEKIEGADTDEIIILPEHSVGACLSKVDELLSAKKIDDADQITSDSNGYLWNILDTEVGVGLKFYKMKEETDINEERPEEK